METKYVPLGLLPTAFCCVRTIVVWKLRRLVIGGGLLLRCVRTIVVWKRIAAAEKLKEQGVA